MTIVMTEGPFMLFLLDREGRLLLLGRSMQQGLTPSENPLMLGHPEFSLNKLKETHAFIAKDCTFKGNADCQLILIKPRLPDGNSGHGLLELVLRKAVSWILPAGAIEIDFKEPYSYSGECHAECSLNKLKEMAGKANKLSGVYFMLKGTQTTTLYRHAQTTSSLFTHHSGTRTAADLLIDRPPLKTNIPLNLLKLDRKQFDAGIRIVAPELDENYLPSVRETTRLFESMGQVHSGDAGLPRRIQNPGR